MKTFLKNSLCCCALIALFSACHKDTVAAEYFFTGQFAGAVVALEISANSEAQMVTSNDASLNAPNCRFSYDCGIGTNFSEPTEKSVSITFPNLFSGKCSDQSTTFPLLFAKKPYSYGAAAGNVVVTYVDATTTWTTLGVPQSSSTFNITESEVVKVGFSTTQKVSGTLSCTLINAQGVQKKLDGATFTLSFEPYPL